MYKKCLTCQKMGVSCDGPNFMAMSTDALVEWCIQRRKQMPGMTYDKIAEATGLSKGTVSGFFNKTHSDYRLETIRPILKILVGGDWDDNPCDDPAEHERAKYEAEISRRDETIARLEKTNASLEMLVTNTNARYTKDKDFLRSEMKRKNRSIAIFATLFALCLSLIIAALVIDYMNEGIGFFWLRGLLYPSGVETNSVAEVVARTPRLYR